jgi:hypothetical protein
MYKTDCKEIEDHAWNNPEGLRDVVEFTLCTIQAGLHGTLAQRKDISKQGLFSRFLWGKKAAGLEYVVQNNHKLWTELGYLREKSTNDLDVITEVIFILMKIPNIGLVKAGFIAQMLGFNVACLDSHNLKRLGKDISFVTIGSKLKKWTKYRKIKAYVEFCQVKGSEYWWNSWCEYVAGNRANKDLATKEMVSRFHVKVVKFKQD